MNRCLAYFALASILALPLGACSPDDERRGDEQGSYSGPRSPTTSTACARYSSCGSCTPVVGCGWCEGDDGSGSCASGPAQCTGHSFHWNWEPSGCGGRAARDADTSESGAADSEQDPPGDAGGREDAPPFETAAVEDGATCGVPAGAGFVDPVDRARSCTPTFGGTLCGGVLTVACHGSDPSTIPAPRADLGCSVVPAPTPNGTVFYCCPCAHP